MTRFTDRPKAPADLTDKELLREWEGMEDWERDKPRVDSLAAELERRQLDF